MRFPTHIVRYALLVFVAVLAGCSSVPGMQPAAEPAQPVPGSITVVDAVAQPAAMAGGNGVIYLTILNGLDEETRLVAAESPVAQATELHETVNDDGIMRMIPRPEGFVIPAGAGLELVPGGKHIMLIGVEMISTGSNVPLELSFLPTATLTLSVPVVEITDTSVMTSTMHMDHSMHGDDAAGTHTHDDHGDAAETHTHEDHGDAAAPEMGALMATLPIAAVHALDEALDLGEAPADAQATLVQLLAALDDGQWPESAQPAVDEMRESAEALQAALIADDLTTAAARAKELHDRIHDLEHSAGGH